MQLLLKTPAYTDQKCKWLILKHQYVKWTHELPQKVSVVEPAVSVRRHSVSPRSCSENYRKWSDYSQLIVVIGGTIKDNNKQKGTGGLGHLLAGNRRCRCAIPSATTKHCAILKSAVLDGSEIQKNTTAVAIWVLVLLNSQCAQPGVLWWRRVTITWPCKRAWHFERLCFTFMTWAFSEVKGFHLHAQSLDVSCLKLQ